MREIARQDYDQAQRVAEWPIREGLLCLLARRRELALDGYRFESLFWAITAPNIERKKRPKPPQQPEILKDPKHGKG